MADTQTFMVPVGGKGAHRQIIDAVFALDPDKAWNIEIKPHRKRRTLSQNRMLWAWLNEIADIVGPATGYYADELHEIFKQNFLEPTKIEVEGLQANYRSTTKLDTKEMAEYCDRIYNWAQETLSIELPLPPVGTEPRG